MYYKTEYNSPIGKLMIASDGENIVGLWMEGQKYFANAIKNEVIVEEDLPVFKKTKEWLDRYFEGKKPSIDELPLTPIGSPFRQKIWNMLCEIPYGKVITYGDIAKRIAKLENIESMSSQAVGGAVGHNPISIIIPCHRVVGSGGSLTGYAGGIDKKVRLLEHEGCDMNKFKIPTKGTAI